MDHDYRCHSCIGYDYVSHAYIGRRLRDTESEQVEAKEKYIDHDRIGRDYLDHDHICHNYVGHGCAGHNYVGHS